MFLQMNELNGSIDFVSRPDFDGEESNAQSQLKRQGVITSSNLQSGWNNQNQSYDRNMGAQNSNYMK